MFLRKQQYVQFCHLGLNHFFWRVESTAQNPNEQNNTRNEQDLTTRVCNISNDLYIDWCSAKNEHEGCLNGGAGARLRCMFLLFSGKRRWWGVFPNPQSRATTGWTLHARDPDCSNVTSGNCVLLIVQTRACNQPPQQLTLPTLVFVGDGSVMCGSPRARWG